MLTVIVPWLDIAAWRYEIQHKTQQGTASYCRDRPDPIVEVSFSK